MNLYQILTTTKYNMMDINPKCYIHYSNKSFCIGYYADLNERPFLNLHSELWLIEGRPTLHIYLP